MRLTAVLRFRYPKPYYWGFGKGDWGQPKQRQHQYKLWKRIIKLHGLKPIPTVEANLPENVIVEDPCKFVEQDYKVAVDYEALHPWPYEKVPEKGTPEDPNYKQERALLFDRRTVIYEGFKGATNFCNTVIESDSELPPIVNKLEEEVDISSKLMDVLNRRIDWCRNDDGSTYRLPKIREFPRLNIAPLTRFGPHPVRKEFNTLSTLHDVSDLFASCDFGFIDRRKLLYPQCSMTFNRGGKLVICDLVCDFITSSPFLHTNNCKGDSKSSENILFSSDIKSTIEKPLIDVSPCNWEICFDKTHFYDEEIKFAVAPSSQVHTIYLATGYNHQKKLVDRFLKGRAVMFCYGYAVSEARRRFGNPVDFRDAINYKDLPEPITIQCVFLNDSKTSVGFACFQLNTLSFDSNLKNQLWFAGPYDYNSEREEIMRKLIAIHRLGAPRIVENQRIVAVN